MAKALLKYPAVTLGGVQARAVARGIADALGHTPCVVYACCVLPTHVHLVVGRPHLPAERLTRRLKAGATRQLLAQGLHPLADHTDVKGRPPTP